MASSASEFSITSSSPPATSSAEPISPAAPAVPILPPEVSLVVVHPHKVVPPHGLLGNDVHLSDGLLQVRVPPGMGALLTGGAVGAEAGKVAGAELAADVLLAAGGAEGAEAAVVVGAGGQLGLGVDVEVEALVAVGAVAVADEEVALGHLAQVVLVQELAALALLAERAQPVLADERVVARVRAARRVGRHVPVRARRAQRAVPRDEGLAYGPVRREPVAVGRAEEGREAEGVAGRFVLEDLLRELRGRRWRCRRGHGCLLERCYR